LAGGLLAAPLAAEAQHAAYWQYFMVDPATGQGMTRCTAPNDGSSAIAMRSCP